MTLATGPCSGPGRSVLRRGGPAEPEDERLIAAGRIWAVSQGDAQAAKILRRPTVGRDALAVALDHLAIALAGRRYAPLEERSSGDGRAVDDRRDRR